MTKTLFVMRHGKSDWNAQAGDHERPLKKRGRRAAERMGRLLSQLDRPLQRILSSTAVRARETALLVQEAGALDCPLELRDELYLPSPERLVGELQRLGDEQHVLTVGHEPSCSSLVAYLSEGSVPSFPTAALACLELSIDSWSDLGAGVGRLEWLVTPRLLEQAGEDGIRRSP